MGRWEVKKVEVKTSEISQKEFEQRLDELMNLLLDKSASSKKNKAFSVRNPKFDNSHVVPEDNTHGFDAYASEPLERTGSDG